MVTSHKYEHDEDERRSALSWTFWLLPLGYDFITLFFEALLWTAPVSDKVYFIAAQQQQYNVKAADVRRCNDENANQTK